MSDIDNKYFEDLKGNGLLWDGEVNRFFEGCKIRVKVS